MVCTVILISSCKKTEIPNPGQLAGKWLWVYTWNDGAPGPTNPLTPRIAGHDEQLFLNSDYSWFSSEYGELIDPITITGSYSIGHGSYTPYKGAFTYNYDSIVLYKNKDYAQNTVEYYKVSNDTLTFSSGFRGFIGGGSKVYAKQSELQN
jgi:hypothetical protein